MNIEIFKNKDFKEIRTTIINNEPWFVGKDIAENLGYKNGSRDINRHVDNLDIKKEMIAQYQNGTLVKTETILINESGLYSLILSSKLKKAKEFKRWVTNEVLPTIRRHGAYMNAETLEQALLSPDFLIKLAKNLKDEKEKNKELKAINSKLDEKNKMLRAINSKLDVENEIMTPKAEYFDQLVSKNLLTNFRDTAKMLKINQKMFINFLIDKGYVYRDIKGKLKPFSDKNKGLFEIKESMNFATGWTGTQTLITPLGREHFRILTTGLQE